MQALLVERALVGLEVAERAQQHHHVSRPRRAALHESRHPLGQHARLGRSPAHGPVPSALVAQQQLDRWPLVALAAILRPARAGRPVGFGRHERPVVLAESPREHRVYPVQQGWAAAEVTHQREAPTGGVRQLAPARRGELRATGAEQAHVGVPEPVDRLQLVADREEVAAVERLQDRELARVGVLELVHHQHLEAPRPRLAHARALVEQLARQQLEVVEVHRAAAALERLIGAVVGHEQLIDERAGRDARDVPRMGAGGRGQARAARAAAAKLRVDALHHGAHPVGAVGCQEVHRLAPLALHELLKGEAERPFAQPPGGPLVEDRELRVQPGDQRVRAQQAGAEPVERADEGRLGVARGLPLAQLVQAPAHARPQLTGRAIGEGDREDPRRGKAVLADRPHEALDQHRGLPAPGPGGEQQRLVAARDRLLLLDRQLGHGRWHRQIVG